jgi:hypothetical protein
MKTSLLYTLLLATAVEPAAVPSKQSTISKLYHHKRQADNNFKPGEPLCLGTDIPTPKSYKNYQLANQNDGS